LTKNHDKDRENSILTGEFNSRGLDSSSPLQSYPIQLIRLTGEVDLKSADDLTLYSISTLACTYTIYSGSKFTMYEI